MRKTASEIAVDVLIKVSQPKTLSDVTWEDVKTYGGKAWDKIKEVGSFMRPEPGIFATAVSTLPGASPIKRLPHEIPHTSRRGGHYTRTEQRKATPRPGYYDLPPSTITGRTRKGKGRGRAPAGTPQWKVDKWNRQYEAKQQRGRGATPAPKKPAPARARAQAPSDPLEREYSSYKPVTEEARASLVNKYLAEGIRPGAKVSALATPVPPTVKPVQPPKVDSITPKSPSLPKPPNLTTPKNTGLLAKKPTAPAFGQSLSTGAPKPPGGFGT